MKPNLLKIAVTGWLALILVGCGGGSGGSAPAPTNAQPVAAAGADQNGVVGIRITLDGRASSDPDGDPLAYAWEMTAAPQGSLATLLNPLTAEPGFTPDKAGLYTFGLVVNDGLADSVAATVT